MSVLRIRTIPDDVLRIVCDPITQFNPSVASFADDLLETMYAAPGRGLAAPQVGVAQRMFVMDPTWKSGTYAPQVLVNPVVASVSREQASMKEGCLSIPEVLTKVTRPSTVSLRWVNISGEPQEGTFTGFAAACVQHEIDHLNGILFIDHLEKEMKEKQ